MINDQLPCTCDLTFNNKLFHNFLLAVMCLLWLNMGCDVF